MKRWKKSFSASERLSNVLKLRSYLKKVFWPNLRVGREYQILEIPRVFLRFDIHGRLDLEPKYIFKIAPTTM